MYTITSFPWCTLKHPSLDIHYYILHDPALYIHYYSLPLKHWTGSWPFPWPVWRWSVGSLTPSHRHCSIPTTHSVSMKHYMDNMEGWHTAPAWSIILKLLTGQFTFIVWLYDPSFLILNNTIINKSTAKWSILLWKEMFFNVNQAK